MYRVRESGCKQSTGAESVTPTTLKRLLAGVGLHACSPVVSCDAAADGAAGESAHGWSDRSQDRDEAALERAMYEIDGSDDELSTFKVSGEESETGERTIESAATEMTDQ